MGRCGLKRKVQYRDEAEANRRARVRMNETMGLVLYSYLCPLCKRWHLTKMPRRTHAQVEEHGRDPGAKVQAR